MGLNHKREEVSMGRLADVDVGREGKILLIEFVKLCWKLATNQYNQWSQIRERISRINDEIAQEEPSLVD